MPMYGGIYKMLDVTDGKVILRLFSVNDCRLEVERCILHVLRGALEVVLETDRETRKTRIFLSNASCMG